MRFVMESIINTAVWAAIIQGLLLGALYVFSKKHNSFANRLLGFFLFCLVFEALTVFFPVEKIGTFVIFEYFALPEVKLLFPLLFMHFVLEKIGRSDRYLTFFRIHYSLAFCVLGITLFNLLLFAATGFSFSHYIKKENIEFFYMGQQFYAFFLTIIAFFITIKETLAYKHLVKNEYSDYEMLEINWLWQFIFTMLPIALLWGAELVRIILGGMGISNIVLVTWGLVIVFIYFISYKAFRNPNLFEGVSDRPEKEGNQPLENKEPRNLGTSCEQLKADMEAYKYYLNQDLTIYDLAKEVGISSRLISTCINKNFGCNFSEWVNNYRVEEALSLLKSPNHKHLSIEGIGLDSGFKSRSAMYTAFKKKTGEAPGNFRQILVS